MPESLRGHGDATVDQRQGLLNRCLVAALLLLTFTFGTSAFAEGLPIIDDDDAEPATAMSSADPSDASLLVDENATWRWQVERALPLTQQLAAIALAGLDVAAGRRTSGLTLDANVSPPPSSWPRSLQNLDEALLRHGPTPIGTVESESATITPTKGCDCRTAIARTPSQRITIVRGETTFSLDDASAEFTVLELRLRYRDGVAVWLNGVEVARRSLLARGASAPAERVHGPEWESVYIPIGPGLVHHGLNTLTVEVRPIADHRDASIDVRLAARRGPSIVLGPLVQRVIADGATVVVETDVATTATLDWGPSRARGTTLHSTQRSRRHEFELRGLAAGQAVYYVVEAGGARSTEAVFHAAPSASDVVRIALYGDVRGGHRVHASVVAAMQREAPDLVLSTGDLVLRGSDLADWQQFFAVTAGLMASVPYYPTLGNHDLGRAGDDRRRAADWFALPPAPTSRPDTMAWYSFDVAGIHVAMLDSNSYQRPAQATWLEEDLTAARARGVRAILAVTHDGPYSRGSHRGNRTAQRTLVPILARHHVTLLASGHDHLYQRGRAGGVTYIVTGGGGAPLYAVACGVTGKPSCTVDDGSEVEVRAYHYAMLTVGSRNAELCVRKPDNTLLEPCITLPL